MEPQNHCFSVLRRSGFRYHEVLRCLSVYRSFILRLVPLLFLSLSISPLLLSQPPTNGLVGYWPFSGNANDGSGNGHHGTVHGATLVQDRFGSVDRAYSFDGINDSIVVPDHTDFRFDTTESFSISLWTLMCVENETGLKMAVITKIPLPPNSTNAPAYIIGTDAASNTSEPPLYENMY